MINQEFLKQAADLGKQFCDTMSRTRYFSLMALRTYICMVKEIAAAAPLIAGWRAMIYRASFSPWSPFCSLTS